MKNIRQFLFGVLFLLSAIPIATLAYTGQYPWDPIYVAPTQQTLNSQTEQSLKSQYGISAFYDCYACADSDTSNPYTQTSCLSQTKYCLESKAIASTTQCSSGYVYFNGRCVTLDNGCKEQYGILSLYSGEVDSQGKFVCGCENGYAISKTKNLCVTVDARCKEQNGEGSYYSGVKKSDGKYVCDCSAGYAWNSDRSYCTKSVTSPSSSNSVGAGSPAAPSIPEGAIIKTADNPDVYIIKYMGSKKFKRLILSPSVFKSYGHLKWEDLITVSQQTMDTFTTSRYVKAVGDTNIYQLFSQGDTGEKRLVAIDLEGHWSAMGINGNSLFDYDAVYEINAVDRDSYVARNF